MATTTLDVQHAGGAVDHGHGSGDSGHGPTSTGIDNKKLLMWWFLGSDGVLFGAMIATFMIYRNRAQDLSLGETVAGLTAAAGPFPNDILDQLYTAVSAGVLLFSSFTMVLAVASIGRGNIKAFRVWTLATAMLGGIFLAGQLLRVHGVLLRRSQHPAEHLRRVVSSSLTGIHGLHVFVGVLWLLGMSLTIVPGRHYQEGSYERPRWPGSTGTSSTSSGSFCSRWSTCCPIGMVPPTRKPPRARSVSSRHFRSSSRPPR